MSEVLTLSYGYTAKDLAAVRAYVQRVAPAVIARTYYDADEDGFAATPSAMERHLRGMLDGLVKVAIEQGSPALARGAPAFIHQKARGAEAHHRDVPDGHRSSCTGGSVASSKPLNRTLVSTAHRVAIEGGGDCDGW